MNPSPNASAPTQAQANTAADAGAPADAATAAAELERMKDAPREPVTLITFKQGAKGQYRATAELPRGPRINITGIRGFDRYQDCVNNADAFVSAFRANKAILRPGEGKRGRFRVIAEMPYGARINISGPRGFATKEEALADAAHFSAAMRGKVTMLNVDVPQSA